LPCSSPLTAALLTLASQGQSLMAANGPLGPRERLAYSLRLGTGERLLGYSWDDGPEIPYLGCGRRVELEYGERSDPTPAQLYLPMNSWAEAGLSGATLIEFQGVARAEGRFGPGLALAAGTRIRLCLPDPGPDARGWTVSFWLRPTAGSPGREFLQLTDALALELQAGGRLDARLLAPMAESIASLSPLELGDWNSVSVSYDPDLLGLLLLVVNEEPVAVRLASGSPQRALRELVLGDVAADGQSPLGALDELSIVARPSSSQQAILAGQRVPEPGPHGLRLRTNQRYLTVTPWSGYARDQVIDRAEEFARGHLAGAVVAGDSLRWAAGRWREFATANTPPARTTHPTVALGGHELLIFGGETRDTHLWPMVNTNDTWMLDTRRRTWRRVAAQGPAPSPRCHVPAAYSAEQDLVLLVGGWRNDDGWDLTLGDTWAFDVVAERWEPRAPLSAELGFGLRDHVLLYHPGASRFLLLSGRLAMLYDPVSTAGRGSPRCRWSTRAAGPFGGGYRHPTQGEVFLDTTALYDLASNRITVLAPPVRPPARVRGAFARDSRRGRFVLFGGVRDQYSTRMHDLWSFDPATRLWTEHEASGEPSARGGYYGMAYDERDDRFVLTCGRHDVERFLDETWTLELGEERVGGALYAFDRAGLLPGASWFLSATTPGSSRVDCYFRTSADGARFGPWRASLRGQARFVQVAVLLSPGSNGEQPSVQALGFR
jgi:hypothetical protein